VKRNDFQELARVRIKEARRLLEAECPEGAYYLAGYAAECALKACIARLTERYEFPDKGKANESWTHDLTRLARAAGVLEKLLDAASRQSELNENWEIVAKWTEESRYQRRSRLEAEDLLNALADPKHGLLRWVKHYW
jgi:HEPN domain-containing protein